MSFKETSTIKEKEKEKEKEEKEKEKEKEKEEKEKEKEKEEKEKWLNISCKICQTKQKNHYWQCVPIYMEDE
jgi:hypothetical protein